ncbi:MAG: CoA transferase, partial [Planctomycetota bacterium]
IEWSWNQREMGPVGNTHRVLAPHGNYPCRGDDQWIAIACGSEEEWQTLARAAERLEWLTHPEFHTAADRRAHRHEIDGAIAAWTSRLDSAEALTRLERAEVPAGPINSVADIASDPHFRARGVLEEVDVGGRPLKLPALGPKLSDAPGRTEWAGPAVGAHTDQVLRDWLGLDAAGITRLRAEGVV